MYNIFMPPNQPKVVPCFGKKCGENFPRMDVSDINLGSAHKADMLTTEPPGNYEFNEVALSSVILPRLEAKITLCQ